MNSVGFHNNQFTINGSAVNYGKNYIINGGFDRWDYATSQTVHGYGSDNRWFNANNGSTKTHSQVASTDTERALFNSPNFSRTVVTSVVGTGNYVGKIQKIENVTKLAGKTITVSFWAKADASKNIAISFDQYFGTGGTPSSTAVGNGVKIAITSSWARYSSTFQLPSIVGKTLGTDGVHITSTAMSFWFDAGSNFDARTANLGQQSGTFDIAEVQLEEGSIATPWTPYFGEFGGEEQACQRYYRRSINSVGSAFSYGVTSVGDGLAHNANWIKGSLFSGNMRVTPTLSYSNASGTVGSVTRSSNSASVSLSLGCSMDGNFSGLLNAAFTASEGVQFSWSASAEL